MNTVLIRCMSISLTGLLLSKLNIYPPEVIKKRGWHSPFSSDTFKLAIYRAYSKEPVGFFPPAIF